MMPQASNEITADKDHRSFMNPSSTFTKLMSEILPFDELNFPAGSRLLTKWQNGDPVAAKRLKEIMDATFEGKYDEIFKWKPPQDSVHVCGPVDLMMITVMYELYGLIAEEFYKDDAERLVRAQLMAQRLLGMSKLYVSWPVYGLTAEAIGQTMIYSDQYSPGTDPDKPLANRNNWQEAIKTPDFHTGIPKILDDVMACYQRLTGFEPVLHLTGVYSMAADIYGQEHLINAINQEPDFVNQFLDLLVDRVHKPWIDHFFNRFPNGWVEFSDASGSPFFIGPDNCKNMAIRAIKRLVDENSWGPRVYDANYRGDYVTQARKRQSKPSARRRGSNTGGQDPSRIDIDSLFELKHGVCPDFVIRLAEDRVPVSFYTGKAIEKKVPLFTGIGATMIDRNSVADWEIAKQDVEATAIEYVEAIKSVANAITKNGYDLIDPPWPGNVYFEDISGESSFDLIEIIVAVTRNQGALQTGDPENPVADEKLP